VKERIDLVAVVSILFACMSCDVGEEPNLLNHINFSVQLFLKYSPLFSPSSPGKARSISEGVRATLQRYELCCALLSGKYPSSALSLHEITIPDSFATPDQARVVLHHALFRIMYLLQPDTSVRSSANAKTVSPAVEMRQILAILDHWDVMFAQLRLVYKPDSRIRDSGMHILQIQSSAARILLSPATRASLDELVSRLHEQVIAIPESLTNVKTQLPYDSGLLAILTIMRRCEDLPNLSATSRLLLQDIVLLIR